MSMKYNIPLLKLTSKRIKINHDVIRVFVKSYKDYNLR